MLESITERIAREKAELAQAALEREAAGPGRNIATTISEKLFIAIVSKTFFPIFAC